jgi:ubiquinol-cytochrome c reductase iron-sulfur subunit
MFNVRNGAVPQFGPAPRPLPQMHLGYNDQGYFIAMAPYDQPVGPGFYERTTT